RSRKAPFFKGTGYPSHALASLRHRLFRCDSAPVSTVEHALACQEVEIPPRSIHGNFKMIREFSDCQLTSNAKEAQKLPVPFDRKCLTKGIVRSPHRKAVVNVGTSAVLARSCFRFFVD